METNVASTMMEAADFSKIVVTICENTQRTSEKILSLCKNAISFLFLGLKGVFNLPSIWYFLLPEDGQADSNMLKLIVNTGDKKF
jgi:hypothetical protein